MKQTSQPVKLLLIYTIRKIYLKKQLNTYARQFLELLLKIMLIKIARPFWKLQKVRLNIMKFIR